MRKKKFRVNVQDRSLKKTNKTNYCDKKQKNSLLITERFRMSLRSFNEKKKKEKTTSDSRAAISFSAPPKMKEN